MICKLADGEDISVGDTFIKYAEGMVYFRQGVVTRIENRHILVDFGDIQESWAVPDVALFATSDGDYMEFYSSAKDGLVINDYRS